MEKLELIKIEMILLQGRFDKYDDLIFRSRNWFMTLWIACMGATVTTKSVSFLFLAVFLSVLYWVLEGMIRYCYWYKYVLRYRTIRDELNKVSPDINHLSVYDLTNKYMNEKSSWKDKFKASFFKIEPIILYAGMAFVCVLGILLLKGIISLPVNCSPPNK